ncbi:MAG: alkaline phosphatase family protein [Sedimentisphaerales bacterium]|nr:alkaline phosphatase family protein [Sedimentisphaerales bacterium]
MSDRRKIVLIGLDGFTWSIGRAFLEQGVMPNLARLVAEGCSGNLRSVIPFTTAPAWSSFMTGAQPGKTRVYSFHGYDRIRKQIFLNSFSNIALPSLWELADQGGKSVVSLNMPVTSPPPKVNGVVIPGLLCPGLSADTVHPAEAYVKYIAPESGYRIVDTTPVKTVRAFVDQQIAAEKTRARVGLRLMRDFDWDIFCYQMQSTDRVQHHLWSALDPAAVGHHPENRQEVLRFYRACDDVIGQLLQAAGPEVVTMIVSDHGFCRLEHFVFLNVWLKQKGYLHLKQPPRSKAKAVKESMKRWLPPLKWMARLYGKLKLRNKAYSAEEFLAYLQMVLDMEKTSAFAVGSMSGLIYLNGTETQRATLAKKLTDEILADLGPGSDLSLVTEVKTGSEMFGPTEDQGMPDLVVNCKEGVFSQLSPHSDKVITRPAQDSDPISLMGTHSRAGVYVVHGPNVASGKQLDAEIVDIAPTVLASLGLAVPKNMDGRPMVKAFTSFPEITYSDGYERGGRITDYSTEEQADIEKRLNDLGYM